MAKTPAPPKKKDVLRQTDPPLSPVTDIKPRPTITPKSEVEKESVVTDTPPAALEEPGLAAAVPQPATSMVPSVAPDPFDLETLRLGQDFASAINVKKIVTTVSCRKPHRHEYVRVRPGQEYRFEAAALEDKNTQDFYLVDKVLWAELAAETFMVCLFLTLSKHGAAFLWPVKLPGPDGKTNTWNQSSLAAATEAERRWVRVASNKTAGQYDVFVAAGDLGEPAWPELAFAEILKLAFADKIIRDMGHPFLRSLRGEA